MGLLSPKGRAVRSMCLGRKEHLRKLLGSLRRGKRVADSSVQLKRRGVGKHRSARAI